jgi:hypothetical protein
MKIKIVKCEVSTFWYFDRIGEEHEVVRAVEYPHSKGFGFEIKDKDGKYKYVDETDAEIIFEEFQTYK